MKQIPINKNYIPPMPVVLVGTVVNGKTNFMTVGWCSRVNASPPMIGVGINKVHLTPTGIIENETFSVCVPDSRAEPLVDYCGVVSGKRADKSGVFETFSGELENAPLIKDCPVNLECRLVEKVDLPSNYFFIGEIVGAYGRDDILENEKIVQEKIDPMILTMPDNRYWKLGQQAGKAWKDGLEIKKERND